MLAVKTYARDYIDDCRAAMEAQLAAYEQLSVPPKARASFEPLFCNNLTFVLDQYFVHRTRAIEGKDGNPLNEVRMLCTSLLTNHAVLVADKTIKYEPESSVLKLAVGDEIALDRAQFRRLFEAYFAELEARFT